MKPLKQQRALLSVLNSLALVMVAAVAIVWGKDFRTAAASLDASWREGLVQATDQGLRFGSDVVFTFGPFHQTYTNTVSENLTPLLLGRWVLGLSWGAAALALAQATSRSAAWGVVLFLALSGSLSKDAPFFALQLLMLLLALSSEEKVSLRLLFCVGAGLVVSVLTKLSFAISALPVLVCSAIASTAIRRTSKGKLVQMGSVVLVLSELLWVSTGQHWADLPQFFAGSNLLVMLGHSSAMALDDPSGSWQIPAYWISAVVLLVSIMQIAKQHCKPIWLQWFVGSTALVLFWTSFKAGMMRHDGHGSIAGLSLACFAMITLAFAHQAGVRWFPLAGALGLGLSITSQYFSPIRSELDQWLLQQHHNTTRLIKATFSREGRQALRAKRRQGLQSIQHDVEKLDRIPRGATVDAIPWDIASLTAQGLSYKARPMMQSITAYSQQLQELNQSHFAGPEAPDYLVINARSIDQRIPPDLDYPSLEIIASRYQTIGSGSDGSLILKRCSTTQPALQWRSSIQDFPLRRSGKHAWLELPPTLAEGSRFSIQVERTLARQLIELLFKPKLTFLRVRFNDGSQRRYRLPLNASRKIPLYPWITNNATLLSALQTWQHVKLPPLNTPRPTQLRLEDEAGFAKAQLILDQPAPAPTMDGVAARCGTGP